MIKVIIDTNIALAGILSYSSTERKIINHALKKNIRLVGSKETLEEFIEKIDEHERFKKVAKDFMFSRSKLISTYRMLVRMTDIPRAIEAIKYCNDDPDDDSFVHAAIANNAKIIVSNDKHLLNLKSLGDIRVINAQNFFEVLHKNFG